MAVPQRAAAVSSLSYEVPVESSEPESTAGNEEIIKGRVVGVHDGDTLTLLAGEMQIKVRLNGIDAPEIGQPLGDAAKQHLSSLCFGKDVQVISCGIDRYGRTLGDVRAEGQTVNQLMVCDGFAWHFVKYSADPILAALERDARVRKVGLWTGTDAVPPWEWRGRNSE